MFPSSTTFFLSTFETLKSKLTLKCSEHLLFANSLVILFAYTEIWLMLMLMLKYCEKKTLFHG